MSFTLFCIIIKVYLKKEKKIIVKLQQLISPFQSYISLIKKIVLYYNLHIHNIFYVSYKIKLLLILVT